MDYNVNDVKQPQFKHICGQCKLGFNTDDEYTVHTCSATGFKPTDPEHLGEEFIEISKRAVARGQIRKELEAQGIDPHEAQKKAQEVVGNAPIGKGIKSS